MRSEDRKRDWHRTQPDMRPPDGCGLGGGIGFAFLVLILVMLCF